METQPVSADGEGTILPPGVLPLEPGDPAEIGRHRLLGRLGSGGMGLVYLGRDPHGAFVAVKTSYPRNALDDEVRRRFQLEAACARRVPPACTARVLADGTDETPPYIITEYIEGRPLARVIDGGGPLPPEQLLALATGVARALAAIHEAGLVHRDLKPANILLTPTGPRVIDFGIAQEVSGSGGLTGAGLVMGSPGWIPPERLRIGPAAPASDVFGWGCLVAYAATGRNPFGQGSADEVARRTLREPPDLDGLDDSLRRLVEAALVKDPAARPDAPQLLARLAGGTMPLDAPYGRRLNRPVIAAALVAGAAALVIGIAATGTHPDAEARNPGNQETVVPPAGTTGPAAPTSPPVKAAHPNVPRAGEDRPKAAQQPATENNSGPGKGSGGEKTKGDGKGSGKDG